MISKLISKLATNILYFKLIFKRLKETNLGYKVVGSQNLDS